jgi:cytidine deaminase
MTVSRHPSQGDIKKLVTACYQTLIRNEHPSVKVAAAVQAADGSIHTGVQVRSHNCGHCATCAEVVAIGAALTAGIVDVVACVAVARTDHRTDIWSPCGTCREILRDLHVAVVVVAETPAGEYVTATPDELLPWP